MRPPTAGTVRLPLLIAGALLLAVACSSGGPTIGPTSGLPSGPPSTAPSSAPTDLSSSAPSVAPSTAPSQGVEPSSASSTAPSTPPTQSAGPSPSDSGASPTPSASAGPEPSPSGAASVCSGAKDTPDFYQSFASSVNFPVYCAVLPAGWSLVAGTYRLANGGRIQIQFRRRSDNATFELDEGSFCPDSSGCVPSGSSAGSGSFGDLTGDLVQTSNGYALVVAKGEKPSWLATGSGLDQATFEALTAALVAIN
jgi:hypothetical protein